MAKSKKLDESIALLDSIRDNPSSEKALTILKQLLQGKQSIPAANAAKLIGDAELRDTIPMLLVAFPYWMEDPVDRDPGCFVKFRIAEALYKLEVPNEEIFLVGVRHRQLEAVWGGKQDTACSLRNVCALGLVNSGYADVMLELADLLADPEPSVRSGAIRAIAYSGRLEATPLLRYKAQVGDPEISVMSDCFAGLLEIAPKTSIPLIARFLENPKLTESTIVEMAVLALGESKAPEAFPILKKFWQQTFFAELKKSTLLAIAMLRNESAMAFLKEILRDRPINEALDALEALGLYKNDQNFWEIVEMIVEARGDNRLFQALHPG